MLIERSNAYEAYQRMRRTEHLVATQDPLGLNDNLGSFVRMNELEDTELASRELLDFTCSKMALLARCSNCSFGQMIAMALTRDLDMLASALMFRKVPLSVVPGLSEWLVRLAHETGEVPTGTIFHYTLRNSSPPFRRTFTSLGEENVFISALTFCMECLNSILAGLEVASDTELASPEFPQLMQEIQAKLACMTSAMEDVGRISPVVFTMRLRPFFPPKEIGGVIYHSSNGGQAPLFAVDLALHGGSEGGDSLRAFRNENYSYLPSAYRDRIRRLLEKPSILERFKTARSERGTGLAESASAVLEVQRELLRFRGKHFGVSKKNFDIRPPGAVGSGGYNLEILEKIIRETHKAGNGLRSLSETLAA